MMSFDERVVNVWYELRQEHLKKAMRLKGSKRVEKYLSLVGGKFRVSELARLLKVSDATVRKVVKKSNLEKLGGGFYLTNVEVSA